jgi:TonB family protein
MTGTSREVELVDQIEFQFAKSRESARGWLGAGLSLAIHLAVLPGLLVVRSVSREPVTALQPRMVLIAPALPIPRAMTPPVPRRHPSAAKSRTAPAVSLPRAVKAPRKFEIHTDQLRPQDSGPPALAATAPQITPEMALAPAELPHLPGPPIRTGVLDSPAVGPALSRRHSIADSGFDGPGLSPVAAPAHTAPPKPAMRFGDTTVSAPARRKAARTAGADSAVEILSKPQPAYTEEARRLRIEGEVWLEALFRASGEVQVVRVVRGLGHGLDESAIEAARRIRFRAARQDGVPVDSSAVIRIRFELAF